MPVIKEIKNQDGSNNKRGKKGHPPGGSQVFKRGKFFYIPIPAEIFQKIIGDKGKFYWTELDKSAQLASDPTFTTIPALSNPETAFGSQNND